MTYQDTFIGGRTVDRGERQCAARYDLIRHALPLYTRPWTLLDLGAAQGYFGLRLAAEHEAGCVAVMIDSGSDLLPILMANRLPLTIGLQHTLTEKDLEDIADCEHLDVVLALNILHHFPDPSRALQAVLRIGETVFVEVPGPADTGACGTSHVWLEELVRAQGGVEIGETPSHTTPGVSRRIYRFQRPKASLVKPYIGADAKGAPPMRAHHIVSVPNGKVWFMPERDVSRHWAPGINLQTYLTLGGVYPPREQVARLVEKETHRALFGSSDVGLAGTPHWDVRTHNFILAGELVTLIDFADPRQEPEDDRAALAEVLQEIRRTT